jgi:RNA polymerase sigma factor for flagellar operon FliA
MTLYPEPLLYQGIQFDAIRIVRTEEEAAAAAKVLLATDALGFDTESKPTFVKGQLSAGPHLIQLATDDYAYLYPVVNAVIPDSLRYILETDEVIKVGFGLRDDIQRLRERVGVHCSSVIDLAHELREGSPNDVGARTAVSRYFGMRMLKSKRVSTSNWASPRLSDRQLLYAADDALVALRVYRAWRGSIKPRF